MKIPDALRTRVAVTGMAGVLSIAAGLIAYFEGYKPTPYHDPIGILTVCYGHTGNINSSKTYTKQECDELLKQDLANSFSIVDRNVTVWLPVKTRAALASFVFNVGETKFKSSRLLHRLNDGQTLYACNELSKWVFAGGKKLPGLVRRREAERELCIEGFKEAA